MRERRGKYYFVTREGKWLPLGGDRAEALEKYAVVGSTSFVEPGALDAQIDAAMKVIHAGGAPGQRKPLAPKTIRVYASYVKIIKRAFRAFTDPKQLKGRDIAKLKTLVMQKHGIVPANIVLSILRNICGYWMEHEIVDNNFAAGVRFFPGTRRNRLITPQEFATLYKHADDEMKAILNLWRYTGQRVMDVVHLKRTAIRAEGLHFVQQKTKTPLLIGWNRALRTAIEQAKSVNDGVITEWLFFTRGNRGATKGKVIPIPYNTMWQRFTRLAQKAGIENVQQRDLRAMAITMIAKEHGVAAAKALAAHRDERTTEIYIRDRGETLNVVQGPTYEDSPPRLKPVLDV